MEAAASRVRAKNSHTPKISGKKENARSTARTKLAEHNISSV